MVYIEYPENANFTHDVPFYLATEEFVARRLTRLGDCLFLWQVEPTVIFGRNQVVEAEVNLSYCQAHGVRTFRRKSGGGCVYADKGNVMVSYITDGDNVAFVFNRYINLLALTLCKAGIEAKVTGRNDILVDGRKISGSAYYFIKGIADAPQQARSIVHGTLLYDTDMENMVNSITPPAEKLAKNGVKSVRQRIGLLKDYTTLSLEEVKDHIRKTLSAESVYTLTAEDLKEIAAIRETYLSKEFIFK